MTPLIFACLFSMIALAQPEVCPRAPIGGEATDAPSLQSVGGKLNVDLSFRTYVDRYNQTRYCYLTKDGVQAPTLRVHPGDELIFKLTNDLPEEKLAAPAHDHPGDCGGGAMTESATNLHFHGLALPPVCHQDETLRTLIRPSSTFEYRVKIPATDSPGLYWYHPHPHGYTEPQVLGGASGALVIEGIENTKPEVAGLPERVLVLRDQRVSGIAEADEDAGPGKDLSINFAPVLFPLYRPAAMTVRPGERQFWRVLNASADTYFDLQIRFGAIIQDIHDVQPIRLIAIDGVPVGGSDDKRTHILLTPGGRAEVIVTTPPLGTWGQLVTLAYDTGPDGAASPFRVIANIRAAADAASPRFMPAAAHKPVPFTGLASLKPVLERKLYFSESHDTVEPNDPNLTKYFITVEGATPKVFDMNSSEPDITVEQGTVEDWTIENRAKEAHSFHIHQLHFQLLERDGAPVNEPMLRDTVDVPYWDGKNAKYPSIKVRMDFRNPNIEGTFVYHCHILEHEDGGMMGSIQVISPHKTGN